MLPPWLNHYNLLIFDRVNSTNNEALSLAKSGVGGEFVIVAKEQSAGKGSKGRSWESLIGNLHMSILLRPQKTIEHFHELSFLTAIALQGAIVDSINKLKAPSAEVKLKWPNDVLINGKKLAGILLESGCFNNVDYVIIGVGVNTHFIPKLKNRSLEPRNLAITSLFNEGIILKNSTDFLSSFMDKFHFYYSKWNIKEGFDKIRAKWLKSAYRLNSIVTLDNGTEKISGTFKGINEEGAICIELSSGEVHSFSSGQVTYNE